jgi:hypothetical protein
MQTPKPKPKPKQQYVSGEIEAKMSGNSMSMNAEEQRRVLLLPKVHKVGRFWSVAHMHDKPLRRLMQIHAWFSEERIEQLLMPLTRQGDKLSLRALDWLVTNYSKKENIVLKHPRPLAPTVNVYDDYQTMLTFWRRKYFDPFRRHQRIYFWWHPPGTEPCSETVLEETTVGQLNFLHWAETNGIIAYAREHVQEIERDMARCMFESKAAKKEDKQQGLKRKRRELSKAPKRRCCVYNVSTEVKFDVTQSGSSHQQHTTTEFPASQT